jgi:hypothetical protein
VTSIATQIGSLATTTATKATTTLATTTIATTTAVTTTNATISTAAATSTALAAFRAAAAVKTSNITATTTTTTTTTTAANLTQIIEELVNSGLIHDETSIAFFKAAMVVVVLVGKILGALFCTCLWGVCRGCCHEEKKLKNEREKKLAAAALFDIVQRHRLQTPHKHEKHSPIHRWGGGNYAKSEAIVFSRHCRYIIIIIIIGGNKSLLFEDAWPWACPPIAENTSVQSKCWKRKRINRSLTARTQ